LRKESENIAELKNILGTSHLPAGTLQSGAEGIKTGFFILMVKQFEHLKMQNWQTPITKDCHLSYRVKKRQVTKHIILF
jgi:hypothetical protein